MIYSRRLYLAAVIFIFTAAFVCANGITQLPSDAGQAYYVSAEGNDANNGFSEQQAFKTLNKAVTSASAGGIKRIVVIGTLDSKSEANYKDDDSVFSINNSGDIEIIIIGKDEANQAKLLGGDGKRVVNITGKSRIRFENIFITGGVTEKKGGGIYANNGAVIVLAVNAVLSGNKASDGGGIYALDSDITILDNAVIDQNEAEKQGGGVSLNKSSLIVRGEAVISGNTGSVDGGGIYAYESYVVLDDNAVLEGNISECGGGFCIEHFSSAVVRGEVIVKGNKSWGPQGGGGLCAGVFSNIHMTGGIVTDNASSNGGGVYLGGAVFTFSRGSITDNAAKKGGGIYSGIGSALYIEDDSFVDDNFPDDIFEYDNVFDY